MHEASCHDTGTVLAAVVDDKTGTFGVVGVIAGVLERPEVPEVMAGPLVGATGDSLLVEEEKEEEEEEECDPIISGEVPMKRRTWAEDMPVPLCSRAKSRTPSPAGSTVGPAPRSPM